MPPPTCNKALNKVLNAFSIEDGELSDYWQAAARKAREADDRYKEAVRNAQAATAPHQIIASSNGSAPVNDYQVAVDFDADGGYNWLGGYRTPRPEPKPRKPRKSPKAEKPKPVVTTFGQPGKRKLIL